MFVEQLVVKRVPNGPPDSWLPPISQSKPLDEAINTWVDQTGNELVGVPAPSLYMHWLDAQHTIRLVVASVLVTYIPAVNIAVIREEIIAKVEGEAKNESGQASPGNQGWEPV